MAIASCFNEVEGTNEPIIEAIQQTDELTNSVEEDQLDFEEDPDNILYSTSVDDQQKWRKRKATPLSDAELLSVELLTSTYWVASPDQSQFIRFVFFLDGIVMGGAPQSGISYTGEYSIFDNKLVFSTLTADNWFKEHYSASDSIIFEYEPLYQNLFFRTRLTSDDLTIDLHPKGLDSNVGTTFLHDDVEVEKMEPTNTFVTSNLEFRYAPSTSSDIHKNIYGDIVAFYVDEDIEDFRQVDFLLPGQKFQALAQKTITETIGGIDGRWTFGRTPQMEGWDYGWVFGEYLDLATDENSDEYESLLGKSIENEVIVRASD